MNDKFFYLPKEKRNAIINAALHVFARYSYKKASTDEIAGLAGISKGLIFHYFECKKGLYLFLYKYSGDFIIKGMGKLHDYTETDFFRIIINAQMCKRQILLQHPDIMLFIKQAYFEENPDVKDEIDKSFAKLVLESSGRFINRVDRSKFKDGVTPEQALNVVLWLSDGFMRSRTPEQLKDLIKIDTEYLEYIELLREQFYKPEYL